MAAVGDEVVGNADGAGVVGTDVGCFEGDSVGPLVGVDVGVPAGVVGTDVGCFVGSGVVHHSTPLQPLAAVHLL